MQELSSPDTRIGELEIAHLPDVIWSSHGEFVSIVSFWTCCHRIVPHCQSLCVYVCSVGHSWCVEPTKE